MEDLALSIPFVGFSQNKYVKVYEYAAYAFNSICWILRDRDGRIVNKVAYNLSIPFVGFISKITTLSPKVTCVLSIPFVGFLTIMTYFATAVGVDMLSIPFVGFLNSPTE